MSQTTESYIYLILMYFQAHSVTQEMQGLWKNRIECVMIDW